MINIKQDIMNDNSLIEYYLNFINYSVTDEYFLFETRFSTFYEKPIRYIDDKILEALDKLKSEHLNILKRRLVYNRTLQEIADENNITRERVRQIESQTIKKALFYIDKSIIINIITTLSQEAMIFWDEILIKNSELKILFCELITYQKTKAILFDRDIMGLAQSNEFSFKGILNKIEIYISENIQGLFYKNDLLENLQPLLSPIKNIEKIILMLEQKEKLRKVNDQYFFPFLYKSKRPMVEFIFSLYPKGLHLYKEIDFIARELDIFFPGIFEENDKQRTIFTLAVNSENILLWDWGRYLHIKYINPILEECNFSPILNYLDENLNDSQIDLQSCFEEFQHELVSIGIISKYALHTCLKLKYPNEYTYQDSPWISRVGTDREELKQAIKNVMAENRNYSFDELIALLHSSKVRIQQLTDNSKDIIQVELFQYKRKEFLAFDQNLFKRIVQFSNTKVKELDFVYIDLIVDEFSKELQKYKQYDVRIMLLDMLKKYSSEKNFNISNTRIVGESYPITRDSLNFHILLENIFKDKNTFSINDIANSFIKRGLSKDRIMMYYLYSKIKRIVRLDRETFTTINQIGLTQKDMDNINLMLEKTLGGEIYIDDIIMNYNLPRISIGWNKYILTDVTDFSKFLFSPSRENPIYIKKKI